MRRFFTEPENISTECAKITEDAGHITKVLRMNIGDKILIFDGTGYEYTAELTSINKEVCEAKIISKEYSEQEPKVKVIIYQGIPKSDKMEGIIQKSVELGASSIVPVSMDRCVSKLDNPKKSSEKIKRWNKIAVEAAKQCGRGVLPSVESPISFKQAIERLKATELSVMPYEVLGHSGVSSLRDTLCLSNATEIGVMIGPEGGFSDSEAEYAKVNNINMVGLGKRILRTETVSSAILAAIMYQSGEM